MTQHPRPAETADAPEATVLACRTVGTGAVVAARGAAGGGPGRTRTPTTLRGALAGAVGLLLLASHVSGLYGSPLASAHDEAELESTVSSVAGGDTLPLAGHHFEEGEGYALRLLGALREYDLQKVKADAEGTFSLELPIPREVVPGAYQLVAVAEDGDVVARLDLTILEPSQVSGGAAGAESEEATGDAENHGHEEMAARADDIRIERSRSGLGWAVIGLVIGLAGGLGVGLLRRA